MSYASFLYIDNSWAFRTLFLKYDFVRGISVYGLVFRASIFYFGFA